MNSRDKIESLKMKIDSASVQEILDALNIVDAESGAALFDSLVRLTNHTNTDIRVAALRALRFADQSCLTDVIRDNIRDENCEVRRAAAELFHLHDLAA